MFEDIVDVVVPNSIKCIDDSQFWDLDTQTIYGTMSDSVVFKSLILVIFLLSFAICQTCLCQTTACCGYIDHDICDDIILKGKKRQYN